MTKQQPVHRGLVLTACILAIFMTAVEVTIVSTAMPTIISDLGGFSLLGWVFSAYLVTQAISIPLYGRLADICGRKNMLYIGATLFLTASVLCGFAHDMTWMIVFRAVQGAGAGAITPVAFTIVADIYSAAERPRIQGYLSSVWGISAIVGPVMGAFIVQHFNWALVFWINVPIGLSSLYLLWRFFPEPARHRRQFISVASAVWITLAVVSLLLALLQADSLGYWMLLLLCLSGVLFRVFFWQEKRTASPLFPPSLWENRIIVLGNIGGLIIGASMMGVTAFLPTFVQGVMRGSPLDAGITLAMMSVGWPLASTLSGRLMSRFSCRAIALSGSVVLIAGSLLLLMQRPDGGFTTGRVAAFIVGAGMGLINTTFFVSVQNAASPETRGIATASTMFTRMLGSSLGTAVLGATLNLNLRGRLPQIHDPVQQLMAGAGRGESASLSLQQISAQVGASLHQVFMVAAVFSCLALLTAWFIPVKANNGD